MLAGRWVTRFAWTRFTWTGFTWVDLRVDLPGVGLAITLTLAVVDWINLRVNLLD